MGSSLIDLCDSRYVKELHTVSKLSPLTREQELVLIKRYKEQGDITARNEIVVRSLLTVMSLIKNIKLNNRLIDPNDIILELNEHLISALDKYDITSTARFNTFAYRALRYKLMTLLGNGWQTVRMPQSWFKRWRTENENLTASDMFVDLRHAEKGYQGSIEDELEEKNKIRDYFAKHATQIEADLLLLKFFCRHNTQIGKKVEKGSQWDFSTLREIGKRLGKTQGEIRKHWYNLQERHNNFLQSRRNKKYKDNEQNK